MRDITMAFRKRKGHKDLGSGPTGNVRKSGKIYHPVSMYISSGDARALAKKVRTNGGRAFVKKTEGLKENKTGHFRTTRKYAVYATA